MSSTQVLVYSHNDGNKLKHIVDTLLSLHLIPVIINDGSIDNTVDVLRKYADDIDKITFDQHIGFSNSFLSGIRHIIRGSNATNIIILDAKKNNPLYVMQLLENSKKEAKDVIIMNHINSSLSIPAKLFKYIFKILASIFYGFESKDHLSTYALFKANFVKEIISLNETTYATPSFLLVKLFLKAAKNKSYKWIAIDGEKEKKTSNYLLSLKALF